MERILERYQQYSYAERALLEADTEVQVAYHQRPASKPQCFIQITKSHVNVIHRETGALNMGNWRQRLRHYKRVKGTEICVANLVFLLYKDVFSFFRESSTEMLLAPSFCAIFRHLVGEQLEKLTLKELQQLEQQLETALRKIRSRKVNWCHLQNIASLQCPHLYDLPRTINRQFVHAKLVSF